MREPEAWDCEQGTNPPRFEEDGKWRSELQERIQSWGQRAKLAHFEASRYDRMVQSARAALEALDVDVPTPMPNREPY
jgi:hypothetical protein